MKVRIKLGEETVEGDSVGFQPMQEPYCQYLLDDGTILKFRHTVTRIVFAGKINEDGTKQYILNSQAQVITEEK